MVPSSQPEKREALTAFGLTGAGLLGVLFAFIQTLLTLSHLESAGKSAVLTGADNELGYPSSAFAMALFVVAAAVGVALLARAELTPGWWTALVVLFSIGVVFEIWTAYLGFTWLLFVQLLLMAAALAIAIVRMPRGETPAVLGVSLVVFSVIGFFAAFRLTVDKVGTFIDPAMVPSCNFSLLVQCGVNLKSWQGSLFGFPNPLLGVGGWIAPLIVGIMILAGVRFARWFWIALNVGIVSALALVVWLIYQSIFVLSTLCPWCMVTWAVVIPSFWLVTLYNLKSGHIPLPPRLRDVAAAAYTFVPLITLVSYVVIAVIAQLRLDVISHL
jgi:uncharacterized membrane protein